MMCYCFLSVLSSCEAESSFGGGSLVSLVDFPAFSVGLEESASALGFLLADFGESALFFGSFSADFGALVSASALGVSSAELPDSAVWFFFECSTMREIRFFLLGLCLIMPSRTKMSLTVSVIWAPRSIHLVSISLSYASVGGLVRGL